MFETNVLGVLRVTQALLPALERGAGGHVVVTGSIAGHLVYEGGAGYTAAKHGATALVETLRLELNGRPVRVTEVAPGMVHTEEFSLVRLRGDQAAADRVYDGVAEPLTADDIADCIAFAVTRPGARQRRPAGGQAAGPGRAAQGRPPSVTRPARRLGCRPGALAPWPRSTAPAPANPPTSTSQMPNSGEMTSSGSSVVRPDHAADVDDVDQRDERGEHGGDQADDRGPEPALPQPDEQAHRGDEQRKDDRELAVAVGAVDRGVDVPKRWTEAQGSDRSDHGRPRPRRAAPSPSAGSGHARRRLRRRVAVAVGRRIARRRYPAVGP